MPATPITDAVSGESLVGTEPQLLQQVDPGWRRRLNLFTGRALTDTALDNEQAYRGGLLATLGQSITAGTVSGLALTLNTSASQPILTISPGYGISASGEDVVLNSPMKTALNTLAVIDGVTGDVLVDPETEEIVTYQQLVSQPGNAAVGILLLQPVIAQVSGEALDTGSGPIVVSGNLGASCDQDPAEYAFEDWQIADAVRLVFLPWPANAIALPTVDPASTWRNRLAYAIFEAEALLGPDDQLPWSMLGVPVALLAGAGGSAWQANAAITAGQLLIDSNGNLEQAQNAGTSAEIAPVWSTGSQAFSSDNDVNWINTGPALFVDCSAVVRAGGLPRTRFILPAQAAPLQAWQAGTPFTAGSFILDANNNVQVVQTAGTTGSTQPVWNAAFGQTTPDGSAVWSNNGPGSWQPNTAFAAGQFLLDPNGNVQRVVTAGASGSAAPVWNGIYLPTEDGTVTWVNNGSGNPPIIQPALAQARINQLSEQLSQTLTRQGAIANLSNIFATMPPSGILPAAAIDFTASRALWFPPNWSVSAAPVFMEELETVLSTGMLEALLPVESTAPEDATLLEPVEVLVPLPDTVYDPDILQHETVALVFQQEVDKANQARNLTLQQLATVSQELNTLYAGLGPNVPSNPNLIDPDNGLTPDEITGRNAPPPYTPLATETFGTLLESTWLPNTAYAAGQFAIDGNGTLQVVTTAGTSGGEAPEWNTSEGQTTSDGLVWEGAANSAWQANAEFAAGEFILDSNGNLQNVITSGVSGAAAPAWNATAGQNTVDNGVTWENLGKPAWQANTTFPTGEGIIDSNGKIQIAVVGGLSGATAPTWNETPNATTPEAATVWMNNGPWAWQPGTAYVAGQFVVDSQGFMQTVQTAGASAASQPAWNETAGQTTPDGIVWQNGGNAPWQADTVYTTGQLILDSAGNVQTVQTGGISGDWPPSWSPNLNQTTQDSGVTWQNLGHSAWTANTAFAAGQAIIDADGMIQTVQVGGISGAAAPVWNEAASTTTIDAAVTWVNTRTLLWQAGIAYTVGQIVIDSNGNIQVVETAGQSGATPPVWDTTPAGNTTDGGVTWMYLPYYSTDLLELKTLATQAPYTISFTDPQGNPQTIPLISDDDLADLENNGLQHFITRLNSRISQANDLLDTAFLTSQTDIYRYRQNVLGSNAAAVLATSPILATIATGQTAAATATNLQDYINTLIPPAGSTTPAPTYTKPSMSTARIPLVAAPSRLVAKISSPAAAPAALRARSIAQLAVTQVGITKTPVKVPITSPIKTVTVGRIPVAGTTFTGTTIDKGTFGGTTTVSSTVPPAVEAVLQQATSGVQEQFKTGVEPSREAQQLVSPSQVIQPGQNAAATSTDITSQSPMAGAQANVRTLTIAQRLQQSPSQEAMFYSISNRLSFLQVLEMLENDLGLVADDLQILVDGTLPPANAAAAPAAPVGIPVETHTFAEWLSPTSQASLLSKIQNPFLTADSDEASAYSVGVRVSEQHVMMLRALEARVQQYVDFVNLCNTALNNMQSDVQKGSTYLTQLQNNLHQDRQNVSFTSALLADETQRVNGVNAQRSQILQTVQLVAYTRGRTLEATETVPSRQLVPANVASPVPACLQQSVSIPPELREIVSLLREAPVAWLPSVASQVQNLDRPTILQHLAVSTQARATLQLSTALLPSSAAGEPGVYAPSISTMYSADQQVFRGYQAQRASFQPVAIATLSWSLQVATMQSVAAVNDLISSDAVHTEVSNAVSRLIQQISSVATCLYTRAGMELPVNRLAWAEYLSAAGSTTQLQSLAVLPGWNQLAYTDRQQMQLLVDWLFLQIDTSISAATAFMSDVVRTAILLASDVPVDNIIPTNIVVRTQPSIGGVVSLNLTSDRVASGMFVNLYSGASLAARAVVSDLDSRSVTATVTDVFTPGVYLNASDTAHITAQTPQAVALRPLFRQG